MWCISLPGRVFKSQSVHGAPHFLVFFLGGPSAYVCLCLPFVCKFPTNSFCTQYTGWAKNTFSLHSPTEYWGCLLLQKNLVYAEWYVTYMVPWTTASLTYKEVGPYIWDGSEFLILLKKKYWLHIWLSRWVQCRHLFIDSVGKDISNFF